MANIQALGELINWVDVRNKGVISDNLLGINIDKFFMPSVANIIGTDLSSYKLIRNKQFACNPMHVGRDEKMPIALYMDDSPSIVSPAYFVFEVKDAAKINPEYLMLWFRRAEFDRECWYHTDGSVRGGITWDEILEMTVPVPSIEEQNELVKSYRNIERRIQIKKEINDNLEAQAITLFKELQSNLPLSIPLEEFVNYQEGPGIRNWQLVDDGIPFVNIRCLVNNDIDTTICNKISYQEASTTYKHFMLNVGDIIMSISGTLGKIAIIREEHLPLCLNTSIMRFTPKIQKDDYAYLLYYLSSTEFANCLMSQATGSAQLNFGPTHIKRLTVNLPSKEQRILFNRLVMPLIIAQNTNKREIKLLEQLMANCLAILSR